MLDYFLLNPPTPPFTGGNSVNRTNKMQEEIQKIKLEIQTLEESFLGEKSKCASSTPIATCTAAPWMTTK